ncbi:Ankyrin repeat domain-containing protein 26 [Sciurus carolinensis]|uniref:Ankyrin repeat domain-containing protein 26 n=1 Tax=Sciurus carolinensis TaxID=30640 RepID=A0AA41NH39_SCICA|nr:Ankyrin repeat domain-containing protein 26 [Sciurus carolinensis]
MRPEVDTIKHENQEKEKKYLESIEIIKGKYDELQKTIKLEEETLRENIFQYNEQFNNMKVEITMLIFQLEYEKQNGERLETEVKSYCAQFTAVPFHLHESRTSNGYQELTFQRARDEYLHSHTQINFDLSHLKINYDEVSQELTKY